MPATQTQTPWTRLSDGYSWAPEGAFTYTAAKEGRTWTLRVFDRVPVGANAHRTVYAFSLTAPTFADAKSKAREHRRIEATR